MAAKKSAKTTTRAPRGRGSVEWIGKHRFVRLFMPDDTRPRYRLCKDVCKCHEMTDARAEEIGAAIAEQKIAEFNKQREAQAKRDAGQRRTVEVFGGQWTSGELYKRHGDVNKLRPKASAKDDEYRLKKYVYPFIGRRPVADITEQDIETVLNEASKIGKGRGTSWRSKFQVYQVLRRLFALAIMPGRIRKDNPVSEFMRPPKPKPMLFSYLYPSELLTLLHCPDVPIARRVLYALAVYTGLRKGSLYALTWGGVDFENRTLTSLESKTGLPQMFEIQPCLAQLLSRWFEYKGRPKRTAVIVSLADTEQRGEREGETLREDLAAAGVERHAPVERGERKGNVAPLRFHDLRATFVTWAMREGRGEGWISDRTGHLTPEMRARYARAARTLMDLKFTPFPDISGAIPELLNPRDNVVSLDAKRGKAE